MYKNKSKPGHISRTKNFSNTINKKRKYTIKKKPNFKYSKIFTKQQSENEKLNKKLFKQLKQNINKPPIPPTLSDIMNKYTTLMMTSIKKKDFLSAIKYYYLIIASISTYIPVEAQFDKGLMVDKPMGPILSNVDTHVKYHTGYAYPKKYSPINFSRKETRKLSKRTRKNKTKK